MIGRTASVLQRKTPLRRRAPANAPAASYCLRRVRRGAEFAAHRCFAVGDITEIPRAVTGAARTLFIRQGIDIRRRQRYGARRLLQAGHHVVNNLNHCIGPCLLHNGRHDQRRPLFSDLEVCPSRHRWYVLKI